MNDCHSHRRAIKYRGSVAVVFQALMSKLRTDPHPESSMMTFVVHSVGESPSQHAAQSSRP